MGRRGILKAWHLVPWMVAALVACAGNGPPETPAPASPEPLSVLNSAAVLAQKGSGVSEAAREGVSAPSTESVQFKKGTNELDGEAMEIVRQHAERLKADPALVVTLIGRTDDLGSRSYHVAVAERRVAAVMSALRGFEVPRRQIRRASIGGEVAKASCAAEACRSLRRRVDFVYSSLQKSNSTRPGKK